MNTTTITTIFAALLLVSVLVNLALFSAVAEWKRHADQWRNECRNVTELLGSTKSKLEWATAQLKKKTEQAAKLQAAITQKTAKAN